MTIEPSRKKTSLSLLMRVHILRVAELSTKRIFPGQQINRARLQQKINFKFIALDIDFITVNIKIVHPLAALIIQLVLELLARRIQSS